MEPALKKACTSEKKTMNICWFPASSDESDEDDSDNELFDNGDFHLSNEVINYKTTGLFDKDNCNVDNEKDETTSIYKLIETD